jgi:hypothetical protein
MWLMCFYVMLEGFWLRENVKNLPVIVPDRAIRIIPLFPILFEQKKVRLLICVRTM